MTDSHLSLAVEKTLEMKDDSVETNWFPNFSNFALRLNASPYKLKKPAIWLNATSEPTNGFVGYLVADNQKESSVSGRISYGKGSITYMIDNPLFRGFWYQGKLLFSNAIFFK